MTDTRATSSELNQKLIKGSKCSKRELLANNRVLTDAEALGNLLAYRKWMLAPGSWIPNRQEVEKAFDIIEKDLPVSPGANGDVEDLVVGPALPYCFWCNAWTWSSFFIILGICYIDNDPDKHGIYQYPQRLGVALPVFGVFFVFTFRALWLEYLGAMYVLPSQAISSGDSLRIMAEEISKKTKTEADFSRFKTRMTFNEWLVCMLTISFAFHLDICSTAIFIARVVKTRYPHFRDIWDIFSESNKGNTGSCLLDKNWRHAIEQSAWLKHTPMSLPYTVLVGLGTAVMLFQLLYAIAFSLPVSPNLSPAAWDREKTLRWVNCWLAPHSWCRYRMADVEDHEILDHPENQAGKCIGEQGDWLDRPPHYASGDKPTKLNDCMLLEHPPGHAKEDTKAKHFRVSLWLKSQADEIEMADNYQMRLARHRRARVAIFNSLFRHDMGYGRAIQALVESGRMNLMQWQDDLYLKQSEQNWAPWDQVYEIIRTNIRFFLFALQAAFFPFFQVTFYGVVASLDATDSMGTDSMYSNFFTGASVVVGTLLGMKYLWYEVQSVRAHNKHLSVAVEEYREIAESDDSHRRRWESVRLRRRANLSIAINFMFAVLFFIFYVELMIKVVMVMGPCSDNKRLYNMPDPTNMFNASAYMNGCQYVHHHECN